MAKRRRNPKKKLFEQIEEHRSLILKFLWGFVVFICILFGYLSGSPIVAQGELARGIFVGIAYGAGAFIAISISYYINRKLKGY